MEDILAFIVGLFAGLISGLIPGLHSNVLAQMIITLGLDERTAEIILISLFPAHLIASFVPSIFFGIPDEDTAISVLPGQRMVRSGKGMKALKIAILSCIFATIFCVVLFYFSLQFYPKAYDMIKENIVYILIAFSAIFIIRSKNPLFALLIFVVSGILGTYALNTSTQISDPFLPLFSGMFTIAAIATYKKGSLPAQEEEPVGLDFLKFAAIGVVLGMVANLLPGISSSSQVATLGSSIVKTDSEGYLASVAAISVSKQVFSLSTQASINKPREGLAVFLSKTTKVSDDLVLLIALFIMSIACASVIVYLLRQKIAALANFDFSKLNIIIALYLAGITLIIDGPVGLLILALASVVGFITLKLEVERTTLMGSVIIPTILILLRIFL
ncbi:tripartite tricarboxylate transporter permease [Candidatus Micrarchaeota archaeon]|nr:tripartite tricarboxylate transporter permease [Candidatus Micrarchaeota archaeon]